MGDNHLLSDSESARAPQRPTDRIPAPSGRYATTTNLGGIRTPPRTATPATYRHGGERPYFSGLLGPDASGDDADFADRFPRSGDDPARGHVRIRT